MFVFAGVVCAVSVCSVCVVCLLSPGAMSIVSIGVWIVCVACVVFVWCLVSVWCA
jgi:hypothetical protein